MGSDSDWPVMQACAKALADLGIACEVRVISAHRTPDAAHEYATTAAGRGIEVLIAAAGLAAHLAGVLASLTTLPVIGVPMDAGPFRGLDALLSTVQMPPGVPVATVGVGSIGAKNAAVLAAQMLALHDADLSAKLTAYKAGLAQAVQEKDRKLAEAVAEA
jgi:phosphoribosylaminoimidazole carboxylase PurE protein